MGYTRRYQEGAASVGSELCHCGTFAIGLCADCATPVCGDHSQLLYNRLCDACRIAKEADAGARLRAESDRVAHERLRRQGAAERVRRMFIEVMAAGGSPGAMSFWPDVHVELSRRERRRVLRATEKDQARKAFGPGKAIRGETAAQKIAGIYATQLAKQPPHARGWPLGLSGKQEFVSDDGRHREVSVRYHHFVILTDGSLRATTELFGPYPSLMTDVENLPGQPSEEEIAIALRRIAAEHGIDLSDSDS